jgi:hypothetical protein
MLDNANCHSDEVFVNVLAYRCVVSNELRPTGEQLCRRMDDDETDHCGHCVRQCVTTQFQPTANGHEL